MYDTPILPKFFFSMDRHFRLSTPSVDLMLNFSRRKEINFGERKRGIVLLILAINPPQKFHGDELPRVDGLLVEESRQSGVVKLCKLAEVPPLMGHYPRVDILEYSLCVGHAGDLLSNCPIDLL